MHTTSQKKVCDNEIYVAAYVLKYVSSEKNEITKKLLWVFSKNIQKQKKSDTIKLVVTLVCK